MTCNRQTVWRVTGLFAALLGLICLVAATQVEGQSSTNSVPRYDANGNLLMPTGFETWVFVGSNLGLAYNEEVRQNSTPQQQFHNVYINPEAYAHFVATREFPVPTILVMAKFARADREPMGIVSAGSFNGAYVGAEVAVKNSSRPVWRPGPGQKGIDDSGDGRTVPWAYYDFTDGDDPSKPVSSAAPVAKQECQDCHREHASVDNVWVQFYPTLRRLTK